ncbi:MAG: cysteine desulfurase family protein [Candidatus Krumholzibacteria bacterium]|jgi:cysteine desulfurase|nr:cysteine desulfurase family protein [Candidatus Krumholzibacteria bacterium]
MNPMYLDYNATTPTDPRVVESMLPWLRGEAGNPSSGHAWGRRARAAVAAAREQVAALLGCRPGEVIVTSGGSEACNHAVKGSAFARQNDGRHLIVSAIEHPAVTEAAQWLARRGWRCDRLPVTSNGLVEPRALAAALQPDTVLVSVMHANNETGVVQPLAELADRLRGSQSWLYADCAQSAGKIPLRVRELGVDLASIAGHKLYAPKGVGALYVRAGLRPDNLIHGAGQEDGRRAGTEAVAQVVGLGAACALAADLLAHETVQLAVLRDELAARVQAQIPGAVIHGHNAPRLPNTLSIALPGCRAAAVLEHLREKLAASAGAACHGHAAHVSSVLAAMGVADELALATIRFSVGRFTTAQDVENAATLVVETSRQLGAAGPAA